MTAPEQVWVLTLIYEDEPFEPPGILVADTPEQVVQLWVEDEQGGHSFDAQGFPAHIDESTAINRVWRIGQDLLADLHRRVDYGQIDDFGQVIHLQRRRLWTSVDESYDQVTGEPLTRGRCDTCGAPCDDDRGDCTKDRDHAVALP